MKTPLLSLCVPVFLAAPLAFSFACSQGTQEEKVGYQGSKAVGKGPEHGKPDVRASMGGDKAPAEGAVEAGAGAAPPAAETLEQPARSQYGAFTLKTPEGWIAQKPSSQMRHAQFKVSDAELVVFYFGPEGAGGAEANIDRWVSQFQQKDGSDSSKVAQIDKRKVNGFDMTTIFLEGTYGASMGPGSPGAASKPDYAMLGAIVESDKGPYYFKLIGPKATVDGQKGAFQAWLTSIEAI